MEPRVQYTATSDGVSIAYSLLGAGKPVVYLFALRLDDAG